MRGMGEVQSPPRRSNESETAAPSQAGVYTVGQFGKQGFRGKALATIIFHKDKTAQLAIAKLNMDNKSIEESCGSVTFQLNESNR